MLQASKATAVTHFHQQAIEVRRMELDYYLMVFEQLSTISSLLAGFASSALMVPIPQKDNPYIVTWFLLSTASALGSHLLVVIVTTMCIMWGPGHALRGEDASFVDNAVYVMDTTKDSMERFFIFGLICYFVSSILVVWLLFDLRGCIIVTVMFSILTVWLWCKSMRIAQVLLPGKFTSGHVKFNRVKNLGKLLGDDTLSGENGVSAAFASRI
eukprot:TRINITY_DN8848_c0_g1_i1.p1 TRINITY_DN8848_c0_g1~~TRINITY_DN8848_c0_g1_i1.p1  ORF type:complete len:213 (-),score=34.25 TRINITY_DN8848_c0_g1_i1:117-755(-)